MRRSEKRSRISPRKSGPKGRNNELPTMLIAEPQDNLTFNQLVSHMLHCEAKDITLKWVFDHIKNYLICSGILWAGAHGIMKHSSTFIEMFMVKAGSLVLIFSAFSLFALNICHGAAGYSKIHNLGKIGKYTFMTAGFLVFFAGQVLLLSGKAAG